MTSRTFAESLDDLFEISCSIFQRNPIDLACEPLTAGMLSYSLNIVKARRRSNDSVGRHRHLHAEMTGDDFELDKIAPMAGAIRQS